MSQPLRAVASLKVKLGLLVAVSAAVAAAVATLGSATGVPVWLSIPVTLALALAVTQLLASGMTAPLRQMTDGAARMATGDYGVRVTATGRDEVGRLARAFNAMATDLADVDHQRRELVATVSHELRTPLAGLVATLENVVDGVSDPAALQTSLAQAERLSGLVADLLDLARVDAGEAPLRPVPVTLAELLGEAAAEAEMLGRGVRVRVEAPGDLVVQADPARLRQLVTNLLDNATRHSPADGEVWLTASRDGERYRIDVRDQGVGVAPEDRQRVFERFGTAGSTAATAGTGGTGLGLAIARWVTDLHGGSIRFVDPASGAGAHVRVDLPVTPRSPAPSPGPSPARPEPMKESLVSETPESSTPPGRTPVVTAAQLPPMPPPAPARPLTDELFGTWWPERPGPARLGLVGACALVGLLAAFVLPERSLGIGTTFVLLAGGAVVWTASADRRDPFTRLCAGLCVLLAVVPTVRAAEWLAVLCLLLGGVLTVVGITRGRTVPGFVVAALSWPLAGLRGLPWLGRSLAALGTIGRGAALARTVAWSLAGLVVFGLLFTSADALLAEWVDAVLPDLTLDLLVARVFVAVFVTGAVLAAAYLALNPPRVDRSTTPQPVAHRYEWLVPVAVVNAVFVVFLAAQATVVFGGHDHLQRTTGLTYAEWVHQGFGQLTVATALTLVVMALAGRKAPRDTRADRTWLRGSLGLLGVLTLVVVASALHRMALYQEAYGFTRLRLLVDVFEGWLGLVVLAALVGGIGLRTAWVARFALVSGVVAVLGVAAINPDAWIARHNLDRYEETGKVDWLYLQGLSADAVPVLDDVRGEERGCALLGRADVGADDDWLEWNLGRHLAARVDVADQDAFGCEGELRGAR